MQEDDYYERPDTCDSSEFQASAAKMAKTVHTATTGQAHKLKLYRRAAKRKKLITSQLEVARKHVGDPEVKWKKFYGLIKPKCNF